MLNLGAQDALLDEFIQESINPIQVGELDPYMIPIFSQMLNLASMDKRLSKLINFDDFFS